MQDYTTEAIADFLEKYICFRKDDYAIQLQSGAYSRQGVPLTHEDIIAHIEGDYTLGVYQSTYPEELCKWITYDIDGPRKEGETPDRAGIQLSMLKSVLIDHGVNFYVEDSGSPYSYHVWVFLEHPTPLWLAYNWARAMVVRGDKYVFSGEIFPKQAALNPEKPYGNLIKVPFGIHQKTNQRTHFYDSSRGKPTTVMDDVETMEIGGWIPVDLPVNEKGTQRTAINTMKSNKRLVGISDTNKNSGKPIELYRYSGLVRPCVTALQTIQLKHEDGHKLRIAIASELLGCGMTIEEVVKAFAEQEDFDEGITHYQVRSVQGYNRPTCDRIRWHARNLQSESGFKIDELCEACIFAERQEMNHARQNFQ